jgi:hypothetical protein
MAESTETTSEHRHAVRLSVGARDVARILDARPASWLSSFLRLAALRADSRRRPTAPPWFRLGGFAADGDAIVAPFGWRPHLGADLFDSFQGRFVIRADDAGSVVVLEGTASDGPVRVNGRVIEAFVESLGSALEASQPAEG